MNPIKLNSNFLSTTTVVSNVFIDNYMPQANGTYVKVYLYLLRCINTTLDLSFSISAIADKLDETEKDIIRALCYWEKVTLITLTRNGQDEITSITINEIQIESTAIESDNTISKEELAPTQTLIESLTKDTVDASVNSNTEKEDNYSYQAMTYEKPVYSAAQIKQITASDEIKCTLKLIETTYFQRPLRQVDYQTFSYIYENLGFSSDLIIQLYEYCASKNKKSPSYIEAVALSWHQEGVDTSDKVEASTAAYNSNYNAINKAFGLNRTPVEIEKQFINKWLNTYNLSIEIIVEACNRTILATQKPDFKYADKILENWSKKNVKELNDLTTLDEEHKRLSAQRAITKNNTTANTATPSPNNKFNAFPQRNYSEEDYSSLEQRLLERNKTVHR